MERSSPLAAMQPPAPPGPWGFGPDSFTPNPHYSRRCSLGQKNFNFRDLSMKKSSADYFTLRPIRGSSPTSSLAADLSQNFHIDKSPQLPTPRRSLFTSNLFGTLDGRENMTTPPLPSSSPGPGNDSMDMSPLPHKAPFMATAELTVQPPTPEVASADSSMMMSSPIPMVPSRSEPGVHNSFPERKKPLMLRPSLSRAKGYSTNTIVKPKGPESKLPPFKFGTNSTSTSSNSLSLGDCFAESPPQERKLPPMGMMGPPRPRQIFASIGGSSRSGSPANGLIRKPLPTQARPRKQFRRSLSMFEHPGDVMAQEKKAFAGETGLQSIMDVDDGHQSKLPHFIPEDRPECLPRITKETLADVLDGKYTHHYDRSVVIDCRFEYEYEGGHIHGAVNYNDKELLSKELFVSNPGDKTLLIFHCEYSVHRAPTMAKFVRHRDRSVNDFRYPQLTFPEVYILDGGYSEFFSEHRGRCFPQNYVEMGAKEHAMACERGMGRLRQTQRAKLGRAQTFAFGQHGQADSSPTGPSKGGDDTMAGSLDPSDILDAERLHARRMASY